MTDKTLERYEAYRLIGKIARDNWVGKRPIPRTYPTVTPAIDDGIESIIPDRTYEDGPVHAGYARALLWNFTGEQLTRIKAMMEEDIQVIKHLLTQLEEE
tara:strand:- start:6214 stop:6513 length:300 start_codon:yes stop_codon:yes gene_type:complete